MKCDISSSALHSNELKNVTLPLKKRYDTDLQIKFNQNQFLLGLHINLSLNIII